MSSLNVRFAGPGDGSAILHGVLMFARRLGVVKYVLPDGSFGKMRMADLVHVDGAEERLEADLALSEPPFECFIAEEYGEPIGCLPFYWGFSTWNSRAYPWFDDLYARGTHTLGDAGSVQRELFRHLVNIGAGRNCPRIETRSLVANAETRIFYTGDLGMEITHEWQAYRMELPALLEKKPETYAGVVVREAVLADARELFSSILSLARLQRKEHEVNRHQPIERIKQAIEERDCEFIIALRNGAPEGFAAFYPAYSFWEQRVFMMIEDMHVFNAGHGVGRALFEALYAIAVARDYARIETRILSTSPTSPGALAFVGAMGLHPVYPHWRTFRLDLSPAVLKRFNITTKFPILLHR